MIDLKLLRENPDLVRESQRTRGEDPALVDQLLEADRQRREAISAADQARAEQKAFSKAMGQKMAAASDEEKTQLREEGKQKAQAAGQEPCAEAARGSADDALSYDWGYEWPDRQQWRAGRTHGFCWAPD